MQKKNSTKYISNREELSAAISLLKGRQAEQKNNFLSQFDHMVDWWQPGKVINRTFFKLLRRRFPFFSFKR